ncbi:MAG: MBL fold metallo-hydrolase [Clostridia bacterium]|nr:MBL fold metallo-hydrolase [Clostridia bacterium]
MQRANVKGRIISLVLVLVAFVFMLSSCGLLNDGMTEVPPYKQESVDTITVKMLDVGQGDSILIMTKTKTLLIDAGINGCGEDVVIDCLKQYGRKTLDYVIATHPHADHVGGLDEVINYADSVGCVYMPYLPEKLVPTTAAYRNFLESVMNTDAEVVAPEPGDTFKMDDATLTFFGSGKEYDDLNDFSLVVRLDYGESSFIFTGDCRKGAFKDIIKAGWDVDVDVVKAAHHGASNATDKKVFEAMSPEYMLISCGLDNSYGHPHDEVMELLADSDTEFYRTDYNGTITVISDGKDISIEFEKGIKNGK